MFVFARFALRHVFLKLSKGLTAWCCGSCWLAKRRIVTSTKRPLFTVWAPIGSIYLFRRPFRLASSSWCECAGTRNRGTGRRSHPSCSTCRSPRPIWWTRNRNTTLPSNSSGRKKSGRVSATSAIRLRPSPALAAFLGDNRPTIRPTTIIISAITTTVASNRIDSTIPDRTSRPINCWGGWPKWNTSTTSARSTKRNWNESTTSTQKLRHSKPSSKNRPGINQSNCSLFFFYCKRWFKSSICFRREKARKRSYKRYLVRPIQERLIGAKRCYSTVDAGLKSGATNRSAVFLEVEEDSGRPVTVLRPMSGSQATPQLVSCKRRSCRVKVLSHSQSLHRRSWSVGGSNVHQTMMKRSESHLRRLENISEKTQRDSRPPSSASSSACSRSSSDRRNSALVDAGTQTVVEEDEPAIRERTGSSRRSKGDGIESPAVGRSRRQTDQSISDSEEEIEEETYRWERKRGRASGSSQHLSLCESSSQSLTDSQPHFGIGRRYTVDMSQYKYNDTWAKRAQLPAAGQTTHTEKGTMASQIHLKWHHHNLPITCILQLAHCRPGWMPWHFHVIPAGRRALSKKKRVFRPSRISTLHSAAWGLHFFFYCGLFECVNHCLSLRQFGPESDPFAKVVQGSPHFRLLG